MSDPVRAIEDAHAKATPGEWGAYFTAHGDPFIVTDPARPGFTRLASVDVGATDYGRANTEFIAISHNAWPAVSAHIAALTAENARLNEIVGRLPRTEDGVPVTSGMEVWRLCTDDGPGRPCEPFIIKQYASMAASDRASIEWDIPAGQADLRGCYSARESALLARSQREGQK